MRVNKLVNYTHEFLDVLDTTASLVGIFRLQRCDKSAFIYDHLDDFPQFTAIGLSFFD
ncbi:hypothetical protein SDC9_200933 [bioreactor metagenome]|uniref:Uncharacterized protein n=1 Tax=bioreactor metagenome TaxID=1076179 RepID=A0A645ISA7_9ZZZZ